MKLKRNDTIITTFRSAYGGRNIFSNTRGKAENSAKSRLYCLMQHK